MTMFRHQKDTLTKEEFAKMFDGDLDMDQIKKNMQKILLLKKQRPPAGRRNNIPDEIVTVGPMLDV